MVEASEGTLFKAEYEREMEAWLRRRFGWLLGATIVYEVLSLIGLAAALLLQRLSRDDDGVTIRVGQVAVVGAGEGDTRSAITFGILGTIVMLAVAARAFVAVRPRLETREQTLRAANWFILQIGAISFGTDLAGQLLFADLSVAGASAGLTYILFLHLLPSAFLPWTPRESLRPVYPLLSMYILELAVLGTLGVTQALQVAGLLAAAPVMLVPGLLLCWWRLRTHRRRFDRQMVAKGFFAMRRELSQARAVQMALFPQPIRTEGIEFDYAYAPANEVGGDFIHASVDGKGRLDVVLVDVTGHGLASALTVSRLSGEIDRLLAEDPDISPGAVLRALNRYVALTLAKHSVYLTAIAVQLDPETGAVRYVNAGHPPAWVRRGNGAVERFDSTTFLLGAVPDADFDADELEFTLAPDDVLVLVTDGVHEAADRLGRQFGLERIRDMLERTPNGDRLAPQLVQAIAQWSGRVGDDDVLVAALRAPRAVATVPGAGSLALDIDAMAGFGAAVARAAPHSEAVATAGPAE